MRSSFAEGGVGTGTAAVAVVGGHEAEVGREDGVNRLFEEGDETVAVDGDVGDGLAADDECGVIALGSSMLDEEQQWTHGFCMMLADDMAVEEGLKVVVAVVGNLRGVEDGIDVWHGTEMTNSCLVVDDADTILACGGVSDAIETVDDAAYLCLIPRHGNGMLEAEDGEGRQTAVGLDEQTYVADDDLAVDELETVESG
jgi:hypothetical protein